MPRSVVAVLLCVVALSGCSDNDQSGMPVDGGASTSAPTPSGSQFDGSQVKTGVISVDPTTPPPPAFPPPTESSPSIALPPLPSTTVPPGDERHGPGSGDAVVTDVRIEQHDQFARVVYEFGGHGIPAWKAEYVAEAIQVGTSDTISLPGRSILQVDLFSTADNPEGPVPPFRPTRPLIESDSDIVSAIYFTPSSAGITQSFFRGDHLCCRRIAAVRVGMVLG